MTNHGMSEDGHKHFVTQFRAIVSRVSDLATEVSNSFDSLSSEYELTNIWNLYQKEEDEAN